MVGVKPIVSIEIGNKVIPLNIREQATDTPGCVTKIRVGLGQGNMPDVPPDEFFIGASICYKKMIRINCLIQYTLMALA